MDLQKFFVSSKGWKTGMFLGKHAPGWFIRILSSTVAMLSTVSRNNLYKAVTSNLKVVFPDYNKRQINRLFRHIIWTAGDVYHDLFFAISRPESDWIQNITFSNNFVHAFKKAKERRKGVIIVSGHIGNFDIPAIAFIRRFGTVQLLTYPNPYSAHVHQNKIRNQLGVYTTPASIKSVREAIERLKNNGVVATGIEWPDPSVKIPVIFFGRPARLVLAHIKLAMSTGSTIIPVFSHRVAKLKYEVKLMGEPFVISPVGDRVETIKFHAERLLQDLEKLILSRPDQWLMFRPIWDMEG